MINPSMKNQLSPEKLESSLNGLFRLIAESPSKDGVCEICGRNPPIDNLQLRAIIHTKDKNKPKEVAGDIFPLLGTGDTPNFFSYGNFLGAYICAHCLFLSQIAPLGMYIILGRGGGVKGILAIHVHPYKKAAYFIRDAIHNARISYSTPSNHGFQLTENFLIHKVIEITQNLESDRKLDFWKDIKITLYYFLNGNRTNEQRVEIINPPTSSLLFVSYAVLEDREGWKRLVSSGWSKRVQEKIKNDKIKNPEKEISNEIYHKLLHNESILEKFVDGIKRRANTKWSLLEFYCKEVLGMDEKALELIKNVGDRIVETLEPLEDNKLSKRVRELEQATKLYEFENFFVSLEKLRQKQKIKNPLMSFDEFASLLVNYGENFEMSWRTVKNLLLFRIYEHLHDRLSKVEAENKENEEVSEGGDEE